MRRHHLDSTNASPPDDRTWAVGYATAPNKSVADLLHAAIACDIAQRRPATLLDYGCGDGRIFDGIPHDTVTAIYDRDEEILSLARSRLSDRNPNVYHSPDEIPEAWADATICNLVLMMAASANEFRSIVLDIFRLTAPNGLAYFGITHPCFRDRHFRDFQTSFTRESQVFNYLEDGAPFVVTLASQDGSPPYSFSDYHWTIGFTLSTIANIGFQLVSIQELGDPYDLAGDGTRFSPYMLIVGVRPSR